jgi:hypothetical protein
MACKQAFYRNRISDLCDDSCYDKDISVTIDDGKRVTIAPTASMTVMERLFYRSACRLDRNEHNFVSLPGRACYGSKNTGE